MAEAKGKKGCRGAAGTPRGTWIVRCRGRVCTDGLGPLPKRRAGGGGPSSAAAGCAPRPQGTGPAGAPRWSARGSMLAHGRKHRPAPRCAPGEEPGGLGVSTRVSWGCVDAAMAAWPGHLSAGPGRRAAPGRRGADRARDEGSAAAAWAARAWLSARAWGAGKSCRGVTLDCMCSLSGLASLRFGVSIRFPRPARRTPVLAWRAPRCLSSGGWLPSNTAGRRQTAGAQGRATRCDCPPPRPAHYFARPSAGPTKAGHNGGPSATPLGRSGRPG